MMNLVRRLLSTRADVQPAQRYQGPGRLVSTCGILAALAFPLTEPALADPAAARCDFNHDGFADLALGVPGENIGGAGNAGAVNVLYGGQDGLTAAGNQLWHQDSPGVAGVAQAGDRFGAALACGDFDNDGFDDLAIGIPGERIGKKTDAGAVEVLYGSAAGLTSAGSEFWHQNGVGIPDTAEAGDRFGAALAVGDFDHDFADDLAIGVPGEDLESAGHTNAGIVHVLYGTFVSGLEVAGNQLWHQDSLHVLDTADDDEEFGTALAAGDFDDDGFDDLAIGVPGEDFAQPYGEVAKDAGGVNVLNGSAAGLAADRDQFWMQLVLEGAFEDGDRFGQALASGDFNHDGFDDLAIGVPGEDVGTIRSAGAVNVLYGSPVLLAASGIGLWYQDSPSIVGMSEAGDAFGATLAAGDFNGDGFDDLAIGVPSEDVGSVPNAGAVQILLGSQAGLAAAGSQLWHQNSPLVAGAAEAGDVFASALASGDFDHDGFDDLVATVPGEAVGAIVSAGAATVLYGSGTGPSGDGSQIWHQDSPGILGAAEAYDRMGDQPLTSNGLYRIPYLTGTNVSVAADHFSHSPDFNELDLIGTNARSQQYWIVAAAAGTIMAIQDSNVEPTSSNNYVWIAHANGEWTKYTHFQTGSVTALGLAVGMQVAAGAVLGVEGNVGQAAGRHLHFEVAVPDNPAQALDGGGFVIGYAKVPLICGIAGNVLYKSQTYVAGPC